MKKRIEFSKFFLPACIISTLCILVGVFFFVTKGMNLSIDFKAGYIEEVEIKSCPTTEDVRKTLSDFNGVAVKSVGSEDDGFFQVRIGSDKNGSSLLDNINAELKNKYSEINILKTDFIGSQLSKTLGFMSIVLLIGTMICIWIYAAIRFKWDFALASIIALIHDALIMIAAFAIFQVEFSTTSIAAVLTIIGYSINDTVVILDRVRDNVQKLEVKTFKDVINQSLSDTLSRSIITTVTTMFAVVSLYVFTTGSIHDFAWALIIGLISGCYSSLFISSGFIALVRKNWKPSYGMNPFKPKEVSVQ